MSLDLMRLIDKQFLETPFYGVRQMKRYLRNDNHLVNEKRIRSQNRRQKVDCALQPQAPSFRPVPALKLETGVSVDVTKS